MMSSLFSADTQTWVIAAIILIGSCTRNPTVQPAANQANPDLKVITSGLPLNFVSY